MKARKISVAAILFLVSISCAALQTKKPKAPLPPPPPGHVLFDVDLTAGNATPGQVTGGAFEGGWRVTATEGQRIVFDAGHPMAGGVLEVSFTVAAKENDKGSGAKAAVPRKIDWVGLYEDATLTQDPNGGDVFYARTGQDPQKFSRIKAYGKKFDKGEWENAIGAASDWVADDKTVHTVKLEWRGGLAIFHDTKGAVHVCPKKTCSNLLPIDRLRYAFIGSDRYTNLNAQGLRFVRAKLTEYEAPKTAVSP